MLLNWPQLSLCLWIAKGEFILDEVSSLHCEPGKNNR